MITDDALQAAAKEASLALAEALTQGSKQQPPYVPSKSFTCKMSRLCRRERHPVFHRTMQRVAAVFLALLLTGIGWLTVDAEARAATIAWFRSISQNSIVYRFLNPTPQQTLPDYTPTWLPDGFEEQEHHKDDQRSSWYYVFGSDFIVIEVDVYRSGTNMKNNVFRKYISLVLAFVMVLTLSSVTFATYTDGPSNTHYDRDAAADYVVTYTTTANSDYPNYATLGGDCTNFASQVLYAGGMAMTTAVQNPDNASSWYYYYDSVGLGRSSSWTGAHEFRQYWADVNDRGGKHAYEFVKYTAGDFSDEDTWMEIYNYLEPGDIVQYVRTSDWDTYHTQIVHRTSYENGEYKVSMGQHSPFSWANLRNYVNTLSSGTIVCLIKISAPSTRSMDAVNSFNLKSMDALSEQMDALLDARPEEQEEKEQKWAEIAEIKKEMTERTKQSGNYFTTKVTKEILLEYIELRTQINDQLIASYYYDDASNAEMNTALISSYEGENQKLDDFRSEVLGFGDDADYYALWMYFWDELLGEKAPDRYVT